MKALNVFAVIVAWILSIAMVLMLIAAPLMLSALSMLDPENIVQIVANAMVDKEKSAVAQPQDQVVLQNLSAESQADTEEMPDSGNAQSGLDLAGLQGLVGDDEIFSKLLSSRAMSELLGAYTEDVANAFAEKNAPKVFTPELLTEVVRNNIDEIVEIVAADASVTDEEKAKLKEQIQSGVVDKAEEIVEELPSAEEVKASVLESNESLGVVFMILAKRNQIKAMIVGAIALISVLIFALRFSGFRGLRWLSTNLFVAGACNVAISVVLSVGSSAVVGMAAGMNAMGGGIDGIVGKMLAQLTQGVIIRTAIILVAATVLLVVYMLLKPLTQKKKAKIEVSEAEEIIPKVGPVFVPSPVVVEEEPAAEPVSQEALTQIHEILAEEPVEEIAPIEEV